MIDLLLITQLADFPKLDCAHIINHQPHLYECRYIAHTQAKLLGEKGMLRKVLNENTGEVTEFFETYEPTHSMQIKVNKDWVRLTRVYDPNNYGLTDPVGWGCSWQTYIDVNGDGHAQIICHE